jgi:hypothetical protein
MPVDLRVVPNSCEKGLKVRLFGEMKKGSNEIGKPVSLEEILDAVKGVDEKSKSEIGFSDLLDLHEQWRPRFIEFCKRVGSDIERADFSRGYIDII